MATRYNECCIFFIEVKPLLNFICFNYALKGNVIIECISTPEIVFVKNGLSFTNWNITAETEYSLIRE